MSRTQAENTAWPHGDAVVAVNPARRKELQRVLAITGVLGVLLYASVFADDGPVRAWANRMDKRTEIERYEVAMRRLADAGKSDAIIWLAKSHPETDAGRLDALIRAGSGEAAWTLAGLRWKTDPAEAKRLLELAAANGFLPAMQYADRQRR